MDRIRRSLTARGWARALLLRRLGAALLASLAVVLALLPSGTDPQHLVTVLAAERDLAPGSVLHAQDVRPLRLPADAVPSGALTEPADLDGRVLAGAARRGEPLTDVRLAGPEVSRLATGDGTAVSVPVKLSDPDIAELLRAGSRVDVVTLEPKRDAGAVLAENATVVAVRAEPGAGARAAPGSGRLILVAMSREAATRVAGASLTQPMTVTLR